MRRLVAGQDGDPDQHDEEAGQDHQGDVVLRQAHEEAHHSVLALAAACEDHEAQHEQGVREDRADDRRLRDHDLAGLEREDDDEELGQVAEGRLEQARHRRPEPLADLGGRERHDPRQSCESDGRDRERGERRRSSVVRDRGADGDSRDQRNQGPGSAHAPGNLTAED